MTAPLPAYVPGEVARPGRVRALVRGLPAAITFLTRVPVGGFPYHAAEWRWCAGWFPAVGVLVGAGEALAFALSLAAGAWVAAAVSVLLGLVVTGAFHEDGLADSADALGGAYDRERLFAILKDSRIGAFGAAALFIALFLRIALLARLAQHAVSVLVIVGALSRLAPLWLMASLPYVTPSDAARSKPLAQAGLPQLVLATITVALVLGVAWGTGHLPVALVWRLPLSAAGVAIVCGWRFHVRAGGLTGDFLGATQQVSVVVLLFTAALALVPS